MAREGDGARSLLIPLSLVAPRIDSSPVKMSNKRDLPFANSMLEEAAGLELDAEGTVGSFGTISSRSLNCLPRCA